MPAPKAGSRGCNWPGWRFRIRKPYVSREDYREVTARQILELSWFRHVPHAAKELSVERPASFYRPTWMDRTESPAQIRRHEASNSVAFLQQFIDMMSVGRDRPVYKLLHVGVPHRPIVVDRECRFIGETDIFIRPGHRFRTAELFLTNFHLPRSTLFVLVCAFAGTDRMKRAYAHAIREGYRFYSYGDCCLLHRAETA